MRKWLKATLDTVMILLVGGVWGFISGYFGAPTFVVSIGAVLAALACIA